MIFWSTILSLICILKKFVLNEFIYNFYFLSQFCELHTNGYSRPKNAPKLNAGPLQAIYYETLSMTLLVL